LSEAEESEDSAKKITIEKDYSYIPHQPPNTTLAKDSSLILVSISLEVT
jgi:hypothetical protein